MIAPGDEAWIRVRVKEINLTSGKAKVQVPGFFETDLMIVKAADLRESPSEEPPEAPPA